LNLAGNRIRELTEPGAFLYLSQLVLLDLSDNRIRRVAKTALERLEALESLFLAVNHLFVFIKKILKPG
jgi:Leucine-rich repeat (LRR) protein